MPADQAQSDWIIGDAEGGSVADCEPPGPWMSPLEADANARLIAAAPTMLATLIAASHALKSYQFGNASPDLAASIAEQVDKAIAKATTAAA
jgi:hypothetical protein